MTDDRQPLDEEGRDPSEHGSESLRTFGNAWLVIGVIGLGLLLIAYLVTDSPGVGVAVPILLVFLMLGGMWRVQGRRHRD
jgi:hypothetical protein